GAGRRRARPDVPTRPAARAAARCRRAPRPWPQRPRRGPGRPAATARPAARRHLTTPPPPASQTRRAPAGSGRRTGRAAAAAQPWTAGHGTYRETFRFVSGCWQGAPREEAGVRRRGDPTEETRPP